jgi:hypothetical protein
MLLQASMWMTHHHCTASCQCQLHALPAMKCQQLASVLVHRTPLDQLAALTVALTPRSSGPERRRMTSTTGAAGAPLPRILSHGVTCRSPVDGIQQLAQELACVRCSNCRCCRGCLSSAGWVMVNALENDLWRFRLSTHRQTQTESCTHLAAAMELLAWAVARPPVVRAHSKGDEGTCLFEVSIQCRHQLTSRSCPKRGQ